jgi:predicted metalloprotease with PDZ domain
MAFATSVPAPAPIVYTLSFAHAAQHWIDVEARIPVERAPLELYMAVWTPGSYLVREFARHVENLQASDSGGGALAVRKTRKNRWAVDGAAPGVVTLRYQVYANEPSVQGNYADAGFAMLNGAANFITVAGADRRRYEVRLALPRAWKESISGLPGAGEHAYVAKDFDELLDSPVYAGNAPIHEFVVDGKKHFLVNEGEGPMWDGPASAKDVQKIVEEYSRMWGGLPYDRYVFFNMLLEGGGGLEHKNSTWMISSKWAYANTVAPPPQEEPGAGGGMQRANRLNWLGLVSHEYFHLWNVKRLRPVELGPFDYENENYTRSLWLAEGVTSYYGTIALARTKQATVAQTLQSFSGSIAQLQSTPGRLVSSVEANSYDAWIKFYRADENSANTVISYYTKGELAGLLLDAKIRQATSDAKSLDDVMRLAYRRYSGEHGYTPEQFRAVASEVAGTDLSAWFHDTLETAKELDYGPLLDWYGLRFRAPQTRTGAAPRWKTGLRTRTDNGRLLVTTVLRDTPGEAAGFNAGDEILAVNGYRVRPEQWPARLDSYKAGETVTVLIVHRDLVEERKLALAAETPVSWQLEPRPDATGEQKAHLQSWLRQ